jgi:hypothetical protein
MKTIYSVGQLSFGSTLMRTSVPTLILLLAGLTAFGVSAQPQGASDRTSWYAARRKDPTVGTKNLKEVRILFIGNSLTLVNNLPRMVQALVEADGSGRQLRFEECIEGGSTLEIHWNGTLAKKLLRGQDWDFVVLQEQGTRPYEEPASMVKFVKLFDKEIADRKAIPLLYLTFARKTNLENQPKLDKAYYDTAKKVGAEVAPVGPAWAQAMQDLPKVELHAQDNIHPTAAGTYLAACVFYATLCNKSPVGLPRKISEKQGNQVLVDLDEKTARALQEIAWKTTTDQRAHWLADSSPKSKR